jgi:hypothetical protein
VNVREGLANLHDTFLNASLQRQEMHRSPIVDDPDAFLISNRGRFERTWAAFLYVLIESWESTSMSEVQTHVRSVADTTALDAALVEGRANGDIAKLQQVRHYMCHRDRREYWDPGRMGVLTQLTYNERLHLEFSKVLLAAMKDQGAE